MRSSGARSTAPVRVPQPDASPILRRRCECGRHTPAGGTCDACGGRALERRSSGAAPGPTAPPIVGEVLRAPGAPLEPAARAALEPRFGQDLSAVRVHSGPRAAASARAVRAHAYTVGRDIVFGAGRYAPRERTGLGLLAHEVAHTLQQKREPSPRPGEPIPIGRDADPAEREARALESGAGPHPRPRARALRRVSLGQAIARFFGGGTYSDEELQAYLRFVDRADRIENHYDSDNKARAVVARWRTRDPDFELTTRLKVLLIEEMISGFTGDADERAILELLDPERTDDLELGSILTRVGEERLADEFHGRESDRLDDLLAAWRDRRARGVAQTERTGTRAGIVAYLRALDVRERPEGTLDSRAKARRVIRLWLGGDPRIVLAIRRKVALVQELLAEGFAPRDARLVLRLMERSNDAEIGILLSEVGTGELFERFEGGARAELERRIEDWRARTTTQPAPGQPARRRDRQITRVVVDQETTQTVTIHRRDGSTETDICSTGKGHCCLDETAAQGATCSPAESRRGGTNCTPLGTFQVARKFPKTAGGVELWTEFVDDRDIALHEYRPVDGTPLSHGCVRLNREMAQKIYDDAVIGRTDVVVRGLARPRCDHPNLQAEWLRDFRTAGTRPPDGETPQAARRRTIIARRRRSLREIYDVGDAELDELIERVGARERAIRAGSRLGGWAGRREAGAAAADEIPRCVPTVTYEERRLDVSPAPREILRASGFDRFARQLRAALERARSPAAAGRAVRRHGERLWNAATARARGAGSRPADSDDRPLYWARLEMARALRAWDPSWLGRGTTPDDVRRQKTRLLDLLERASRGMTTARFRGDTERRRILVSGFDPFALGRGGAAIRRGNPSGAAALALDGRRIDAEGVSADVQAVVFPVRFADFDAGRVERFFRPYLTGPRRVDMIMTISMGGGSELEVEQFAGRSRSAAAPGNLGQTGGGARSAPVTPPGVGPGPEFLPTTLPAEAMRRALGRTAPLPSETGVTEIRAGETRPVRSPGGPTAGSTAVRGSGGGYLSNEIFYRTALLRTSLESTVPVGHVHTPRLAPPRDPTEHARQRDAIVARIEQLLRATLPHLERAGGEE